VCNVPYVSGELVPDAFVRILSLYIARPTGTSSTVAREHRSMTNMPDVLTECGLEPLQTYISKRQNTLLRWAQHREIYQVARHLEATLPTRKKFWGGEEVPVPDT
jgi:hypothetical protein